MLSLTILLVFVYITDITQYLQHNMYQVHVSLDVKPETIKHEDMGIANSKRVENKIRIMGNFGSAVRNNR